MDEQVNSPTLSEIPPKSPPMAFQMTSNDALAAPVNPNQSSHMALQSPDYLFSPGTQQKLDYETEDPMQQELQAQIEKQAKALRLQHEAFVIERECWDLERDRLYRRVAALESLLKATSGHRSVSRIAFDNDVLQDSLLMRPSPAKSPTISPYNASQLVQTPLSSQPSPNASTSQRRLSATSNSTSRLPSIAENDAPIAAPSGRRRGSSITRDGAPSCIEIPTLSTVALFDGLTDCEYL